MLNDQQLQVVYHEGGPLLVLACPGSGKTRCITERIIHLIDEQVPSGSILAVTFTNKAASEMKQRIKDRGYGHNIMVCTFHSFCVKVMRSCGHLLGYKKNFSICDESDQKSLLVKIAKSKGLDIKDYKYSPKRLPGLLESRNSLLLSDEKFESTIESELIDVFKEYHQTLKASNIMDFGDLIYNTVKLFDQKVEIRNYYAKKYKHILVDEMQDTNKAQLELMKHLYSANKNIISVGDSDQCFPPGTIVDTETGPKKIEEIQCGDKVTSVFGCDRLEYSSVTNVIKSHKTDTMMMRYTLEDGTILEVTHNHLIPMEIEVTDPYVIYMMYKENIGFRIGQCKTARGNSFVGRSGQEHCDKIWIIDTAIDLTQALLKENLWSLKYGIPTLVYHTIGRHISYELNNQVNSKISGQRLLSDLGYEFDIPHHMPRMGATKRGQYAVNIIMCGGRTATIPNYRLAISCDNREILNQIIEHHELNVAASRRTYSSVDVRKAKFSNWRIETSTNNMSKISDIVESARAILGKKLNIFTSLKVDDSDPMRFFPASQAIVGTKIAQIKNGAIIRQRVIKVERYQYTGRLYDLNVQYGHNYSANNVVVHNCVYTWRYAVPDNMLKYEEHFPGAQIVQLGYNYRCAPEIVNLASKLISKNRQRRPIDFKIVKEDAGKVECEKYNGPEEEADEIAQKININHWNGTDFKEMAVLCRTNVLTRVFEEAFRRKDIPYILIGTFGFYDRQEVRNAISFMKFLSNRDDLIAFEDIINTPARGVGPATLLKIMNYAKENSIEFTEACLNADKIKGVKKNTQDLMHHFFSTLDQFDHRSPSESLESIMESTGFMDYWRGIDQTKNEHRVDNIKELLRGFSNYCYHKQSANIGQYLQEIMLLTESDKDTSDNAVRLMTVHASKGLEFESVYIPSLEEDMFPHARAILSNGVEEERRLMYVAITRAKQHLHLSYAGVRFVNHQLQGTLASRFLTDMELVKNGV